MAKTYNLVGWEDGEVLTKAHVTIDGTDYEVTPEEVQGTTPVTAENLRHMDEAIKDLYDGGASTTDIVIGPEEPTTEDWKIWIDTDEIDNLGSEVVDTLEGNQTDKAPSVRAVNEANKYSTEEYFTGKYWIDGRRIYGKVITNVNINTATEHNISNFDEIFDAYGSIKLTNGTSQLINRASIADNTIYSIGIGGFTSTTFTLQLGTAYEVSKVNVVLEYIKTTD